LKAAKRFTISDYEKLILPNFFEPIRSAVKRQKLLLENVNKAYLSYYERLKRIDSANKKSKLINESKWLKECLYELLENEFPEIDSHTIEDTFVAFKKATTEFLQGLEENIKEEQSKERFIVQTDDPAWLAFRKRIKNSFFNISRIPSHLSRFFSKEKPSIKRWNHHIPFRAMNRHFFINQFISQSLPIFEELQGMRCKALNVKWEIDKEINQVFGNFIQTDQEMEQLIDQIEEISQKERISKLSKQFDSKLEEWENCGTATLKNLHHNYLIELEKVNTIELTATKFSASKLEEAEKAYRQQFQKINNGWRNTLFAQIDDFQTDIELYQIKFVSLIQYALLQNGFKSRLNKTIENHFQKIEDELNRTIQLVDGQKNESQLVAQLKKERKRLSRVFDNQIIPGTIEYIYNQNFPNLLERLEVRIEEQIEKMKSQRLIYAKDTYESPINKSELNHFNPKKLVKVDLFNQFSQELKSFKTSIVRQLETTEISLKDLGGIADYNLDTAINSNEEEGSEENLAQNTKDGIERTKSKLKSIEEQLWKMEDILNGSLKETVYELNQRLVKLTKNENITQLRIQLAKAEAYQKTNNYGQKIIEKVKNTLPKLIRFGQMKYQKFSQLAKKYATKIGLIEVENEISAELSDFLLQTELAIQKLPYVYRRLYRIKPTEEDVFFEGRTEELAHLKSAYQNWCENNFSSTVIIGEKGSGASSLVNFFLKDISIQDKEVRREKLNESKCTPEDFIQFFQQLLENDKLGGFNEIAEYLNSGKIKVIILEDLQHFYMKKIHGFEAMNMLFELISATERKVFWLVEFTTYAWDFLSKTISINRYFKSVVQLKKMTEEQIVNIIMKRHRVSGYDIVFDSSHFSLAEQNKAAKLNPEKREAYLKEQYFKALNDFAESNISLALLYWLRSTVRVEENTIVIGQIKNLNFNFIDSLPRDSVFSLHALLLHDSLSISEHALIFNLNKHQSSLSLMVLEDKGILQSTDGRYQINRLLYRQVVNVLQKKNILH